MNRWEKFDKKAWDCTRGMNVPFHYTYSTECVTIKCMCTIQKKGHTEDPQTASPSLLLASKKHSSGATLTYVPPPSSEGGTEPSPGQCKDAVYMYLRLFSVMFVCIPIYVYNIIVGGTWVCGESWLAIKDSLTHRPSSQGWASKCPIIYSSLYQFN